MLARHRLIWHLNGTGLDTSKMRELCDLAIALTRGQDIRFDTLGRNGANSMLRGTMETLQHGKCLVKTPVRSVEIVRIQDHLLE